MKSKFYTFFIGIIAFLIFMCNTTIVEATENSDYTEGLTFEKISNTNNQGIYYRVYSYDGVETEVTIPEYYNGLPVKSIGSGVFEGKNITNIKLPNTLVEIGAFKNCTKLEKIVLPDSVEKVSSNAFYNCTSLKNIDFGNNIKTIGFQAFFGCTSLKKVYLPKSLTTLDMSAFYKCSNLEYVVGGTGLEAIKDQAFSSCENLKYFSIGDKVEEIGGNAFSNCKKLSFVRFGSNVKTIWSSAFCGCESLEYLYLNDGLETIKSSTFSSCNNLKTISVPSSIQNIADYAFNNSNSITDVFYRGTEEQFNDVSISTDYNDYFINAEIHYNHICTHSELCDISGILPSCTQSSYSGGKYCNICGKIVTDMEQTEPLGHNWSDVSYIWNDDKTECQAKRICLREAEHYEVLNAKVTKNQIKNPSCEKEGMIEIIAKFDEDWAKTQVSNINIPAYGSHMLKCYSSKQANCKETGNNTYYKCDTCGKVFKDSEGTVETTIEAETIAKVAHNYKTTTTKATLSKNGSIVTKCTVCGDVKSNTTIAYPKTIKLKTTSYTYDGKAKKPAVVVTDSNGKTIASSNYTVKYSSNKKVGTATATITFKGIYEGTKKLTFKINPKGVSLKKLTKGSKQFKATWGKNTTQTTGYEVQYSTSSKFSSGNKTVTIKKNKTTSTIVKKLKNKKKYYVRIRTYKTVNGKKYYSGWSKVKNVTTKR